MEEKAINKDYDPQKILNENTEFLDSISKKYKYKGLEKDDVYDQAYLYLLEANIRNLRDPQYYVYNKMRNYYRMEKRNRKYGVLRFDLLEDSIANDIKLLEMVEMRYTFSNIKLDPRIQRIIKLFFFGYKEKEISKILGVSQQRISQLKRRGLAVLGRYLQDDSKITKWKFGKKNKNILERH